jgi:hypothetical protein
MGAIEIAREPRGECYVKLLDLCAEHCSKFLLVVQDGVELAEEGKVLLNELAVFLLREKRGYEWPGTGFKDDATRARYRALFPAERAPTILTYSLGEDSKRRLQSAVTGLYDWQQPQRPEDLCLLREDESPFLVSVAHEREAYIEVPNGVESEVRSGLIRIGVEINGEEPDLDLPKEEARAVEEVLVGVSEGVGYKPDLHEVLLAWRDLVLEVESGYAQPLEHYVYDLEVRDLLETILENVPGRTHRKVAEWLSYWDERFDNATREGRGPLTPQATKEGQPWWFRIPRNLGAELEADLISKGLL